jgi:hypothetical protein
MRHVQSTGLGGEFLEDQLTVTKNLIDKMSKYILLPDLDVEVNLDGKVKEK